MSNLVHANCFSVLYCLPILSIFYRMARCKLTARKMTGPRGVPRHQLAPRTGEEATGSRPPRLTRKELKAEIKELEKEREQMILDFTTARTDHYRDVRHNRDLRRELDLVTQQRDDAQDRENERLHRIVELQNRVHMLEAYTDELHEQVHVLWDQLHPDPGAAESAVDDAPPGEVLEEGQDETPGQE
ncbi:MAG TPA: hypothetical protein VFM05_03650 [Candidatus Saccharimonadales bacterium]|nr:hypothetical protein [Candidatus Saccharimonadales bacterium]